MTKKHYNVVIVGAGPAGLSFAASLAAENINTLIIEKQSMGSIQNPVIDGRDIALTHLSKKILTKMNVWQRFDPNDISVIKQAQVLDGDSNYALNFASQDSSVPKIISSLRKSRYKDEGGLGFIVPNHEIRRALYEHVSSLKNVDILSSVAVENAHSDRHGVTVNLDTDDSISCDLLVAADSRFSKIRRQMGVAASMKDFGRSVIVCRAQHERKNSLTAYECFRYGGTLAVLPVDETTASIVVTLPTDKADEVMQQDSQQFSQMITDQFDGRLGNMTLTGERYSYPLVGVLARSFTAQRFALIGDAAVGMHPVTAHGFNLGLRGQNTLAKQVIDAYKWGKCIASNDVLRRYNREHGRHSRPMYHGTNLLVSLFTNDKPISKLARKTVMHVSNNLPPLKRRITNRLTEANG